MFETETKKASFRYIKGDSKGIPKVTYSGKNESQIYSEEYTYIETEIVNARKQFEGLGPSVDKEGFQLVSFSPDSVDYMNSAAVKDSYYAQVEELVKRETGASDVFVFDHTVRRGIAASNRRPAYHAHNDYTFETGKKRPLAVLGHDTLTKFKGRRMIQINVWRSIGGVVERDPLALMDATTLCVDDLVKTRIEFNDKNTGEIHQGEIFALKKNQHQMWYDFPNMDSNEALLIKGFDTDAFRSCFAMHTAFSLPSGRADAKPRESIETRSFAFYDF